MKKTFKKMIGVLLVAIMLVVAPKNVMADEGDVTELTITSATLNVKPGDDVQFTAVFPDSVDLEKSGEFWLYTEYSLESLSMGGEKAKLKVSNDAIKGDILGGILENAESFTKFDETYGHYYYGVIIKLKEGYQFKIEDGTVTINDGIYTYADISENGDVSKNKIAVSSIGFFDNRDLSFHLIKNNDEIKNAILGVEEGKDAVADLVKGAIEEGKDVRVSYDTYDRLESHPSGVQSTIEDELKKDDYKNYNVVDIVDIRLDVAIDYLIELEYPSKLSKEVTISIYKSKFCKVDEEDQQEYCSNAPFEGATVKTPPLADGKVRVYKVLREHFDEESNKFVYTLIDAEEDGDKITFKTDEFSNYAILYEDIDDPNKEASGDVPETPTDTDGEKTPDKEDDKKEEQPADTDEEPKEEKEEQKEETPTDKKDNNPKTGDNIKLYLIVVIVSLVAFIGSIVTIKKIKA